MQRFILVAAVAAAALATAPAAFAVGISVADTNALEGASGTALMGFAVTLDAPAPGGGITVDFATSNGTATAGTDYTAATGTVTIAAGATSGFATVTVAGDALVELDETLTLTLSNPTAGHSILDGVATGTILNDDFWPQCGGGVTQKCSTTFQVDLDGSGPGAFAAPPSGVVLQVEETNGVTIRVKYDDGNPATDDLDLVKGAAPLTTASVIRIGLNVGNNDPVGFIATGLVSAYAHTLDATNGNTIALDMSPSDSSWLFGSCLIGACGDHTTAATVDYEGLAIAASFGWTPPGGLTPAQLAEFNALKEPFRGSWVSTDAQAFSFPLFDPVTDTFRVEVAAPHFKVGGSVLNVGFFRAFLPTALLATGFGISDPSSVTSTTLTVKQTSAGVTTTVTPSVTATAGGVLIDLPTIGYSSPTFSIEKAAPAAAPAAPAAPAPPPPPPVVVPEPTEFKALPGRLVTGAKSELIEGGDGTHDVDAGAGDDTIVLGAGHNKVVAGAGNDIVRLGDGNNLVDTGEGDDVVVLGTGFNTVRTGDGDDRVETRAGEDLLVLGAGNDVARTGAGRDRAAFGAGDDVGLLGAGADVAWGGAGADHLAGGGGNDRLFGGPGRDRLHGGDGDDRIDAVDGAPGDRVTCGRGRDIVDADRGDRIARDCEVIRYRRA